MVAPDAGRPFLEGGARRTRRTGRAIRRRCSIGSPSVAPARGLAWDCGAGSGQAARDLAQRFARVVATDASRAQLGSGVPGPCDLGRNRGAKRHPQRLGLT